MFTWLKLDKKINVEHVADAFVTLAFAYSRTTLVMAVDGDNI